MQKNGARAFAGRIVTYDQAIFLKQGPPRAVHVGFILRPMKQYVAYYRVSTARQGRSGLGLAAQQHAAQQFARSQDGVIVEAFTDVESGKKDDRRQLEAAIARCKAGGYVLLIAKLDRLSRNVGFIFQLRDSGVAFQAADMPEANTLTIGILATLAQHERELISERTKKALAEKKRQGHRLGKPENLTPQARQRGVATLREQAATHPDNVKARHLAGLYRQQQLTYQAIADQLNTLGFRTRNGKSFHRMSVWQLLHPRQP